MKRQLRKMSGKGDELVCEYDSAVDSKAKLKDIEDEFSKLQKSGYFAADITDGKNELIRQFDPEADILMIPAMRGG